MTRLIATLALFLLFVAAVPRSSTHQQSQTKSPASSDVTRPSAISGLVTDGGTGRPLAGALVSLLESKLQVSVGMATDSKGRFVFTNLPASASYIFLVQKPGYY